MDNKTVYILGAGASHEANLPLGEGLKRPIAQALDIRFEEHGKPATGDPLILGAIQLAAARRDRNDNSISPYIHSALRIRDALPRAASIDNLLDAHKGDERLELCGKLAIVRTILEAEQRSLLYEKAANAGSHLGTDRLAGTWFDGFFRRLVENCRASGLEERLSSIVLVVFNYDRCIEHFLHVSLQQYYPLTSEQASLLLSKLRIYHPYGTVGSLPWQKAAHPIGFGVSPHREQLLELASSIRTFTEGTDPQDSKIEQIRKTVLNSGRLVFLGFAGHAMNLDVLFDKRAVAEPVTQKIGYGTAYGLSDHVCAQLTAEVSRRGSFGPGSLDMRNIKCGPLFDHLGPDLGFTRQR